ncbi:MAG: hypothetical protein J6E42_03510, partial [Firmicutes bacterium]|nr:hypothetical protein [Bacillota bacterium]
MKFFIGIFLSYGCDRRLSSWRRPPRTADVKVKRGLPPRHIMSKGPLVRSASVPSMSKWTLAMDA